eukprot:CAMPEP_0171726884 /NCGR_PEP_ID=MMETSP0991-20121206/25958_1 /TAXON_ID=483369 /ORGANISM="non described non described, Strain CCMP2098" /LENGTH=248 /DNA_ID=CAMNT_0012320505 /DNA_START=80 /DNA_END=826 /DNA_ORIENTATION=-
MAAQRDSDIFNAKLAEQAERFDEMVEYMKAVALSPQELSVEERNLLSVAFKSIIGSRRASWRVLSSIEQQGHEDKVALIKTYRKSIEKEIEDICAEMLKSIEEKLLPASTSEEGKVFYHKMRGDYLRYLCEFQEADMRKKSAEEARLAYDAAVQVANTSLPPTHPIRLGVALNFSVFYYEILNSPDRACHLSKSAFDDAIAELDSLSEESYKDSTLLMQLLRDNLTLWTSDRENTGDGEDGGGEVEDM